MKVEEIKRMQKRVGTVVDGFWGPRSIAACQLHLRAMMPRPNPWPQSGETHLRAFYGRPGDEAQLVRIEFPYPIYYEGKRVLHTRCHKRVAASLQRILREIGDRWGDAREIMEEAEDYGGCYAHRAMRGSSKISTHAWGIAIDLDADDNGNLAHWPAAADMPIEIMEAFSREGWLSAGAFWGRDAMHFQATQ